MWKRQVKKYARKIETTEACQKNWTEIVSIVQPFPFIHVIIWNNENCSAFSIYSWNDFKHWAKQKSCANKVTACPD